VQESARDQNKNNFGLRAEHPSLNDVVNEALVFQFSKIGKKKCRQAKLFKIVDTIPV